MAEHDKAGTQAVGGAIKKFIAGLARTLLEIRERRPSQAFDYQLDPEPAAQRPYEFFIAV